MSLMPPIEQAILYIKDHRQLDSALILAKTAGVQQIDEEELIGWAFDFEGDFHLDGNVKNETSSQETAPANLSKEPHLYFHPLPSGCYVLGHLSQFHETDDDAISLIAHCVIVTPKLLRAYHNNILVIYQALVARKDFHFLTPTRPVDPSTLCLTPVTMGVRYTPVISTDLLEAVRDYPGAEVFAQLVSLSVNSVCTFFTWLSPSIPLIQGVIQCLPIPLRPELSFATSLHFSSLRPLRLITAHERSQNVRDICRQFAIPFFHIVHFDINKLRERILANRDWGNLVYSVFDRGTFDDFILCMKDKLKYCSFETQRGTPDWNLLNRISRSLLGEWFQDEKSVPDDLSDMIRPADQMSGNGLTDANRLLRGDSSHKLYHSENDIYQGSVIKETDLDAISEKLLQLPPVAKQQTARTRPASQKQLAKQFPRYEREIRHLDSLLARSLFGDTTALKALDAAWLDLRKRLTYQDTEVIREAYLHLIQSIIVLPRDPDFPKSPQRTIDTLEVMNLFLQE